MNKCCEKWKVRNVGYVDNSYKWNNFCPECGSTIKDEKCECEKPVFHYATIKESYCHTCGKPIPEKLGKFKYMGEDEPKKQIEPLRQYASHNHTNFILVRNKLNEIINYINDKEENGIR